MRRKDKCFNVLICLIIQLSSVYVCLGSADTIPFNHYGLPVIETIRQYKSTIKTDTGKRMVAVKKYVQPLITEWFYADIGNFTHKVLYKRPEAYVRKEAAEALAKVQQELRAKGLGLKFFDAYRPYSVTQKMWEVVPDARYAANPAKGSGHNRGAAVDVTLVNLQTGLELLMPTPFDDFTEKAHHNYKDLPADVIANRDLLRATMEKYGFVALDTEWWHYYLPNAGDRFPLMDLSFRQMKRMARKSRF
jgi:zinc D-Ala-D-Ala dipeptidase